MMSDQVSGRHHGVTYIYGLVDPRTQQLRYIGKTVRQPVRRLATHLWQARKSKRKRHVLAWFSALEAEGLTPEIVEIEVVAPFGDWEEAEQFWIAYFRFVGADLCNLTIGGEGAPGAVISEARREKLRARCGVLSPMFGKPMPRATREALRLGNEKLRSDPIRLARAEANRRAGVTPEIVAEMTARLAAMRNDPAKFAHRERLRKAAISTPAFKAKVSAQSSRQWATKRDEIIAAQNAGKGSEYRRKQSIARKKIWNDPNSAYWNHFLTPEERAEIRSCLRDGMKGVEAARRFGLSQSRISQIKRGA